MTPRVLLLLCAAPALAKRAAVLTPPMGWMAWEKFRTDVSEELLLNMSAHLVSDGYLAAGYNNIHVDDGWMAHARDPATGRLVADVTKFPNGMAPMIKRMHKVGVRFGIYSSASELTCQKFPASLGHESLDAQTFSEWGVDYLKLDACAQGPEANATFASSFPAMGEAIAALDREMVYGCSWPAHGFHNYTEMARIGCNLWRLYHDIQMKKGFHDVVRIMDYWGDNTAALQRFAGPGHWHDPDQLLVGLPILSVGEARVQQAVWAIIAAPLIMGNDLSNVGAGQREVLLNRGVIAVSQDAKGAMGGRVSPKGDLEVWARNVTGGVAVALINKATPTEAGTWEVVVNSTELPSGPVIGAFHGAFLEYAQWDCYANPACVAFSTAPANASMGDAVSGQYYSALTGTTTKAAGHAVRVLKERKEVPPAPISVAFAELGFGHDTVRVRDLWADKDLGAFEGKFTANVAPHDAAMLLLTQA